MLRAGLQGAPASPYNVTIGPHRRFAWADGELAQFKGIKDALGGTVNDVVLTVVTGALRSHMEANGHEVDGVELKAMVPVSVRAEAERGALGNRVTSMFAPLPVYAADPVERFGIVHEAMQGLKESGQAVGAELLTQLTGFAPPTVLSQASRLQSSQRAFNVVVTNVPGPQFPLYLLGRKLLRIYPRCRWCATPRSGSRSCPTTGRSTSASWATTTRCPTSTPSRRRCATRSPSWRRRPAWPGRRGIRAYGARCGASSAGCWSSCCRSRR